MLIYQAVRLGAEWTAVPQAYGEGLCRDCLRSDIEYAGDEKRECLDDSTVAAPGCGARSWDRATTRGSRVSNPGLKNLS